jgi:hypothetical protein
LSENIDIVSLVETKLSKNVHLKGGKTLQTPFNTRGGCWQNLKAASYQRVKAIENNILWSTANFSGALIHIITAYLPSHVKEEADEVLRNL